MREILSPVETRVLGCLLEKEFTTPDQYPLTLNALTTACNQKSNRFPVVNYDKSEVQKSMESLCSKTLGIISDIPGSRVQKFRHFFTERFKFVPAESAILCSLMLRGPQTLGELRTHTNRMHPFRDLMEIEGAIKELMEVFPPWMVLLPRQSGRKESRYMHLIMGEPDLSEWDSAEESGSSSARSSSGPSTQHRMSHLEGEVLRLQTELDQLKEAFDGFRKQFE